MNLPTREVLEIMAVKAYNDSKIDGFFYADWEDLTEQDKRWWREDSLESYVNYQFGVDNGS